MKMEEFIRALEAYVASHNLNLGDGESILSLLYEAYGGANRMDGKREILSVILSGSTGSRESFPFFCLWQGIGLPRMAEKIH